MSNTTTNSPSPNTPSQQQLQDILNQHQQQIQTLSAELRTRPDFTHLVRLMSQEQASLISSITSKQTPFQVPVPEFCGSSLPLNGLLILTVFSTSMVVMMQPSYVMHVMAYVI